MITDVALLNIAMKKKECLDRFIRLLVLSSCYAVVTATSCEKVGYTFDCRGRGLTSIPSIPSDATKVLLDKNGIHFLNRAEFKMSPQLEYLSLKNNAINQLLPESFQGLNNLKFLHLGQNKLCLGNYSYPPLTFKFLPKLEVLNIASNECNMTESQYYPEEAFSYLTSIKTLALPGLQLKLDYGFASMKNLQKLMFIGSTSRMEYLPQDTFDSLGNVTVTRLSLRNTRLQNVPPGLLKPLKHLVYLNLACNSYLFLPDIVKLISDMAGATLHTLSIDLTSNGNGEVIYTNLNEFTHPNFGNLKRLSFRQMALVRINTTGLSFLANLETLVLGQVRLFLDQDHQIDDLEEAVAKILHKSSLKYVALPFFGDPKSSRNAINEKVCIKDKIDTEDKMFFRGIDSQRAESDEPIQGDPLACLAATQGPRSQYISDSQVFESLFFQCLPPKIHTLSLDNTPMEVITRIMSQSINPLNSVRILNLTQMQSTDNLKLSKEFLLSKFPRVEHIEAKSCRIQVIDNDFLKLDHLLELNLDDNDIEYLGTPFGGLPNLRILSIRDNRIADISSLVFDGLTKLTDIFLSGNFITNVQFSVGPSLLRRLDLSYNQISSLEKKFLKDLEEHSDSLTFDVTDNKFTCKCSILPFSDWLKETSVNVVNKYNLTCSRDKETVAITSAISRSQRLNCLSWFIPVVSFAVIIVMFVFAIILFYQFRWKVRLTYYILRRRIKLWIKRKQWGFLCQMCCNGFYRKLKEDRHSGFIYDGFLAHDGNDYDFIQDGFSDRIESWGINLYISERDSKGGMYIVENLAEAIDSSRLVLCLLTPGFAKSEWCDFELKMALDRGKDTVVFIYKDHIPWNIATKTLSKIISEEKFLEYSEDPDGNRLFWAKLKAVLTKGKTNDVPPTEERAGPSIEMPALNGFSPNESNTDCEADNCHI